MVFRISKEDIDEEEIQESRKQCSCRLYNDSKNSEEKLELENNSDNKEIFKNFHEVIMTNDGEYNSQPLFLETSGLR